MGRVNCKEPAADREYHIRQAKCAYFTCEVTSINPAASNHGIPYSTQQDYFRTTQPHSTAYENDQLLTADKKISIVRSGEVLDNLKYPLHGRCSRNWRYLYYLRNAAANLIYI
jgi:hypothetical protein